MKPRTRFNNPREFQLGVTLLEIVISLGILSVMTAGVARLIDQYLTDTKAALTAQQIVTVGNAAQTYIKDNYSAVMASATATTPVVITIPTLIASGHLQSGYSSTNNFNQSVCVVVLEPTANYLNALVLTEGGTVIDDLTLGGIAATIGASGGGIYSSAPTTLQGAMGGWSIPVGNFANANVGNIKCDGTAGTPTLAAGHPIMALWFANGDTSSGFLHRNNIPGRPDLNTMNTPLLMSATTVQTVGDACSPNGALARDTNGAVVSCVSAVWTKAGGSIYWADPVGNIASLLASTCTASEGGQTRVVRMPTTGNGPRAYTCNGSGTWNALSIDDAGNLAIPGTATINKLNGNLQITATAIEGAACTGEGRIASSTSTSGLILSCQSNVWKSVAKSFGARVAMSLGVAFVAPSDGFVSASAQCVATWSALTVTTNTGYWSRSALTGGGGTSAPSVTLPVRQGESVTVSQNNASCGVGTQVWFIPLS